jgi:hypothetical protein
MTAPTTSVLLVSGSFRHLVLGPLARVGLATWSLVLGYLVREGALLLRSVAQVFSVAFFPRPGAEGFRIYMIRKSPGFVGSIFTARIG